MFELHGKVAFIPGGYGGIGAAVAAGLASQGASVAIAGRQLDRARALAEPYLEDPSFRAQAESPIPLGRVGQPRDIVGPVVFFVSPAADFVTGQVLYMDGGITASQ